MIERYGKDIEMQKIRSLDDERKYNERAIAAADAFYAGDGCKSGSICRICGRKETSLYFEAYDGYLYYECSNCGSLFLDNLPKLEEMYRTDNVSNTRAYIDEKIFEERVRQLQSPKVDFVLEVCAEHDIKMSTVWVDVGAGGGQILAAVQKKNIMAYGVESDQAEIEFMRSKGFSVLDAYVDPQEKNEALEELLAKADVVSFMMVLEHVKSPADVVDYFYRFMKPGAVFVLEVPRHPSVASFANLAYKNIVYRHITVPVHLQIFTEKAISMLLRGRFKILGKWGYGEGFSDLVKFPLISNHVKVDYRLYDMIMNENNDIQRLLDEAGLSDMMLFVAVKE